MHIGMTLLAVLVHHQGIGRNKVAGCSASQRREEVLLAGCRSGNIPLPRILVLKVNSNKREYACCRCYDRAGPPIDVFAGKAMQYKQPAYN